MSRAKTPRSPRFEQVFVLVFFACFASWRENGFWLRSEAAMGNWLCLTRHLPGRLALFRTNLHHRDTESLPPRRIVTPDADPGRGAQSRSQAISCDELGITSAISVSLWCSHCGPLVGKDRRFTGHVRPAESLTPRIVAATSAGSRAFIIDVSRCLYVVQKSKRQQKFFIAGSAQPGGHGGQRADHRERKTENGGGRPQAVADLLTKHEKELGPATVSLPPLDC